MPTILHTTPPQSSVATSTLPSDDVPSLVIYSQSSGKHKRKPRIPKRFQDDLPGASGPTPVVIAADPSRRSLRVILHVQDFFRSTPDVFGILREYLHRPSYDPDAHVQPEDLANYYAAPIPTPTSIGVPQNHPPPWPFENMSKYLLMNWFYTGGPQKSEGEMNRLVKEVIGNAEFKPEDLEGFSAHRENKCLDDSRDSKNPTPFSDDDWHEVAVEIEIPVPKKKTPPQKFEVHGLYRRSIVQVIKATWGAVTSKAFHLTPFKRIHFDPKSGVKTRIYDEVYTSEAFEAAHNRLQKQTPEAGCTLEKVIAGLMFWSDSTHLANFGTAKVWPVYMYFANLSKYTRAKPNSGACHHIAYIPSVSAPYDITVAHTLIITGFRSRTLCKTLSGHLFLQLRNGKLCLPIAVEN